MAILDHAVSEADAEWHSMYVSETVNGETIVHEIEITEEQRTSYMSKNDADRLTFVQSLLPT